VITAFVLFDLVDGAMARAQGSGTQFGAVLDSTCDRLADGACRGADLVVSAAGGPAAHGVAAMISLVAGLVVSYLKARAEASGLSAQGGLVERAERLILRAGRHRAAGLGCPGRWAVRCGCSRSLGDHAGPALRSVYRSAAASTAALAEAARPSRQLRRRPRAARTSPGLARPDEGPESR